MADTLTQAQRRYCMSQVRGEDTSPEIEVRRVLHCLGYRFRLHRRDLPGRPDIVLPKYRSVIFVHGCFWHGHRSCPRSARPTSNASFWSNKLDNNIARDKRAMVRLRFLGWRVLVIWECQVRSTALGPRLTRFLKKLVTREGDR